MRTFIPKRILFLLLVLFLFSGYILAETKNEVVFNSVSCPRSIDPQLVNSLAGTQVDVAIMEGLTYVKPNGKIFPAGAESWEISKDGKVYTFNLRKDAKWSNGELVTAEDYYFGIKRALEPSTGSIYSTALYNLVNAQAYNKGKIKDFSKVGVKVINEHTLQMTLIGPCPYFLQLVSGTTFYPCNEHFYNKVKKSYALTPETMLYNGPWKLKSMVTGDGGNFLCVKNPYYWDEKNIKIDSLKIVSISEISTAVLMFIAKELDLTLGTSEQLGKVNKDSVVTLKTGDVYYLQPNNRDKYFGNENIRKAIALAINREALCKFVLKNNALPLYSIVPDGISGPDAKSFREAFGVYDLKENVEKAKEYFNKGLKELGIKKLPAIKLLISTEGTDAKVGVFIQEELKEHLGLDIVMDTETNQGRLTKMAQHNFQIVLTRWVPDYNDPMTYLGIFTSNNENNPVLFSNSMYDKLIHNSLKNANAQTRMSELYDAEKIIISHMAVIPLYTTTSIYFKNPNLKDVDFTLVSPVVNFRWASLK